MSLRERVHQQIKANILTGVYQPNERLVLADLAGQYGTSKTPIRDALQLLERQGLIEAVARVGYLVTAMSANDMIDIFELRKILETAAVELAIPRITDSEIDRLAAIDLSYKPGVVDSCITYLANHRQLHHGIALAAGNPWLAHYVADLLDHLQRFIFMHLNIRDWQADLLRDHQELIAALRERNVEQAKHCIVEQADAAKHAVLVGLTDGRMSW